MFFFLFEILIFFSSCFFLFYFNLFFINLIIHCHYLYLKNNNNLFVIDSNFTFISTFTASFCLFYFFLYFLHFTLFCYNLSNRNLTQPYFLSKNIFERVAFYVWVLTMTLKIKFYLMISCAICLFEKKIKSSLTINMFF